MKITIFHLQFIFQSIRVIKFYWISTAFTKRNFKNRFSLIRCYFLGTKFAIFHLRFIFQSIRVIKFYWISTAFTKRNFKNRFNLIRCYFLGTKFAIFHLRFIFQSIRVIKFYWISIAFAKRNFKNRFNLILYYFFSHLDSTILRNFMKLDLLSHHCTMKCFVRIIESSFSTSDLCNKLLRCICCSNIFFFKLIKHVLLIFSIMLHRTQLLFYIISA